jgi:retron-type reverse transcriptase
MFVNVNRSHIVKELYEKQYIYPKILIRDNKDFFDNAFIITLMTLVRKKFEDNKYYFQLVIETQSIKKEELVHAPEELSPDFL